MIVEESLSYFTKALKIKSLICAELESVAKRGFNLDGLLEVVRCNVDACKDIKKSNRKTERINDLFLLRLYQGNVEESFEKKEMEKP